MAANPETPTEAPAQRHALVHLSEGDRGTAVVTMKDAPSWFIGDIDAIVKAFARDQQRAAESEANDHIRQAFVRKLLAWVTGHKKSIARAVIAISPRSLQLLVLNSGEYSDSFEDELSALEREFAQAENSHFSLDTMALYGMEKSDLDVYIASDCLVMEVQLTDGAAE